MAEIFISYAHEDETRIRELVRAMEKHGWSIFWDRRIPTGKTWQSYIGQALSDAQLVVVAWSHHSINSDWVMEEANDAKERGRLVPILLDSVKPPLGFRGIQSADLTDWKPGPSSPSFDQLIQDIGGVLGGRPPRPSLEEERTAQARPLALPKELPPEPSPQESTQPKPESLKDRIKAREAVKPESSEEGKKRPRFLMGVTIALALAIAVGLALWVSREATPPATKPAGPSLAKVPEPQPKAPEASKAEVKPSTPQPLPDGWIGFRHSGAYIAKFFMNWKEGDQPKSWSSGEKTAGYSEVILLKGNAREINITSQAATGLAWDPWGTIFKLKLDGPPNKVYVAKGTTLSRKWETADR